ncbi:MAG: CDP-2,3-bis-(O-geranylgeranyl)-sn-glycerol synthase [Candidatus Micrarchaeaceae archaeon]
MLYNALYSYVAYPILFILPAYVSNGAPVLFGGGMPLDFKKKLIGKRLFGDHKTVRGLVAGILSGLFVAFLESLFLPFMLLTGLLLTLGTHAGDLLGSFVKRRAGIAEGASVPVLDQYLFFVFALLFALPAGHMPKALGVLFLVILTGLLHIATNKAAYMLKVKKVPW